MRLAAAAGRGDPPRGAPPADGRVSGAILLGDLRCEVAAWHDDPATLRAAIRALDGVRTFTVDEP